MQIKLYEELIKLLLALYIYTYICGDFAFGFCLGCNIFVGVVMFVVMGNDVICVLLGIMVCDGKEIWNKKVRLFFFFGLWIK